MSNHTVPMLVNAIAVLRALADPASGRTLKNLAAALGLPYSSTYRIMRTLVAEGLVTELPGGARCLSAELLSMLYSMAGYARLAEVLGGPLREAAGTCARPVLLSVRRGDRELILAREEPSGSPLVAGPMPGGVFHPARHASGLVLWSDRPVEERGRVWMSAPADCRDRPGDPTVSTRMREFVRRGVCVERSRRPGWPGMASMALRVDDEVVAAVSLLFLDPVDECLFADELAVFREHVFACEKLAAGVAGGVSLIA